MANSTKKTLLTATAGVTVVMALGHFFSFIKEAVIANYFGVSAAVDAYTIAIQIPVLLFSFVSVAIQSVVVPIYSDIIINKSKTEADRYVNNLITLLLVISCSFVVIGEAGAGIFVKLFSPGFDQATHDLCVELLRVSFPTLIFSVISQVLVAVLNVHKKFIWPSFAVYFMNAGIIGMVIWMHSSLGILSACIGQLLGDGVRCLFLILLAFAAGLGGLRMPAILYLPLLLASGFLWAVRRGERGAEGVLFLKRSAAKMPMTMPTVLKLAKEVANTVKTHCR